MNSRYVGVSFLFLLLLAGCVGTPSGSGSTGEDENMPMLEQSPIDTPVPPSSTPAPTHTPAPTTSGSADGIGSVIEIRDIETVETIESFRIQGSVSTSAAEKLIQSLTMEGFSIRDPEARDYNIQMTDANDAMSMDVRLVDGVNYIRFDDNMWSEITKFDLTEILVITPDQVVGTHTDFEFVGRDEIRGRNVLHIRLGREVLPIFRGGSDTANFADTDQAELNLWIDAKERFIVRMELVASLTEDDAMTDFRVEYLFSDFNQEFEIGAPSIEDSGLVPTPFPTNVNEVLGFDFPLPEGASFMVVGATVDILTLLPLDEARAYAENTMTAAGFEEIIVEERAPEEFYYQYRNGERTVWMNVFQVSERGATILVGVPK